MANHHRFAKKPEVVRGFRYIHNIESLSEKELNSLGYYRGFTCPHNHTIRDSQSHWCYFCAKKIMSNICGFDINYVHPEYKFKYKSLWGQFKIGDPEDCWSPINPNTPLSRRVCMPSYRSFYSKQKAENVTIQKALYQCAWGDIGNLVVTRTCNNVRCGNPLHLVSSWNRLFPPNTLHPFELNFIPERLMFYCRKPEEAAALSSPFKSTICNPLEHVEEEE